MRSLRLSAAHLGRLRLKVAAAGIVGLAALVVVYLVFGLPGIVFAIVGLQTLALVALLKVRVDLGRASRADTQRIERHLTGLLHGQAQRLEALERASKILIGDTTELLVARSEELLERGDLETAAQTLREALEHHPSSPELRIQLVEVLRLTGDSDAVRAQVTLLPSPQDATFKLHTGAVRFESLRLRRELDVDPPSVAELATEVQRQIDANHLERARRLAELGYEAHPRSIRLTDRLISVLDAQGEPGRALELAVVNAERRMHSLQDRRPEGQPSRSLERANRVLVAGYFYSGSSAVVDHLLGFAGAVKWTPAGEMRLIKFPGGLADLADRLESLGSLQDQDLVDLYLHLIGRKVVGHGKDVYSHWGMVNRNSRKLQRSRTATGYLQRCFEGFEGLVRDRSALSATEFVRRGRAIVERALDAAATDAGADLLVIDQAVTAWKLDISRFVPPSTFVVVHRDPRDQYAEVQDVLDAPGRSRQHSRTPEGFAARYRKDREQAERLIPALERSYGHRFLQFGFEEFVVEHERVATELATALGLDRARLVERRFDPSVSIANVGKHVGRVDADSVAALEALLPEYLSPHAGRHAGAHGAGT